MKTLKLLFLAGCFFITANANAVLMLQLTDETTGNSVTVTDQDGLDVNSLLGAVTYVGGIDNWYLNVSTGVSAPVVGNEYVDVLDLASLNASGSAGTLTVKLTQTDYDKTNAQFMTLAGGTTAGSVSFATYLDAGNTAFGMSTLLWESDSMTGAYSDSFGGSIDLANDIDGLYSLTLVATITHTDAGQQTSFDHEIRVPEPATLSLLGLGLIGLGFVSRRKKAA